MLVIFLHMATAFNSIFSLLILIYFPLSASAISLNDFVKEYSERDEELLQVSINLKKAEAQFKVHSSRLITQLELSPQYLTSSQDSDLTSDLNPKSLSVNTTLTQSLPFGAQLNFEYLFPVENRYEDLYSKPSMDYQLSLIKSLKTDFLGKTQSLKEKRAKLELEKLKFNYLEQQIMTCHKAVSLYSTVYFQIQKVKYYQQMLKEFNEALRFVQNAYKRKLVNHVKLLSAENQKLQLQSTLRLQEKTLYNELARLNSYLEKPVDVASISEMLINKKSLNEFESGIENSPKLKSLEMDSEIAELDMKLEKNSISSDVSLSLTYSKESGTESADLSTYSDYSSSSTVIGLSIPLDIYNPVRKGNLKLATLNQGYALNKLKLTERNIKLDYSAQVESLKTIEWQIEIVQKQLKVLTKQLAVAYKRLKTAQLDIDDYIVYENNFIATKVSHIDLLKQKIKIQTDIFNILGKSFPQCNLIGGANE